MARCRLTCMIVVFLLAPTSSASGQPDASVHGTEAFAGRWRDLALTEDSEEGFRRFMRMTQERKLGDDVTNANIGIFKNHARVELVRADAAEIVLFLTPPLWTGGNSKYFNVEPGPNATSEDVARVAHALDDAFEENPYELAYDFFNASPGGAPLPGLREAWARDGWRGVVRILARRTASLASLSYTVVVLTLMATALAANVLLLWGAVPPERSATHERK